MIPVGNRNIWGIGRGSAEDNASAVPEQSDASQESATNKLFSFRGFPVFDEDYEKEIVFDSASSVASPQLCSTGVRQDQDNEEECVFMVDLNADDEELSFYYKETTEKEELLFSKSSERELTTTESSRSDLLYVPAPDSSHVDTGENNSVFWINAKSFYEQYAFMICNLGAIWLARAFPHIGAEYLKPDLTADWVAVCSIFFIAGFISTFSELKMGANQGRRFNVFVQVYNFFVVSSFMYSLSHTLADTGLLPKEMTDGMVICSSLPIAISITVMLTKDSGAHNEVALFNASCSNLLGVVISPALILLYLFLEPTTFVNLLWKMSLRTAFPMVIGFLLRRCWNNSIWSPSKLKQALITFQKGCLVYIVYCVFCQTFYNEATTTFREIALLIAFQSLGLLTMMGICWVFLMITIPHEPRLRVAGVISCAHKTLAVGVPLIKTIYAKNSNVAMYMLPLLVWHSLQLILGSVMSPTLKEWVDIEERRLKRIRANHRDPELSHAGIRDGDFEREESSECSTSF